MAMIVKGLVVFIAVFAALWGLQQINPEALPYILGIGVLILLPVWLIFKISGIFSPAGKALYPDSIVIPPEIVEQARSLPDGAKTYFETYDGEIVHGEIYQGVFYPNEIRFADAVTTPITDAEMTSDSPTSASTAPPPSPAAEEAPPPAAPHKPPKRSWQSRKDWEKSQKTEQRQLTDAQKKALQAKKQAAVKAQAAEDKPSSVDPAQPDQTEDKTG